MAITINKQTAFKLAAKLLEIAADEFGNHGCNDFNIPNSTENRELIRAMWESNGDKDAIHPLPNEAPCIETYDWMLMSFLAKYFEQEAKK